MRHDEHREGDDQHLQDFRAGRYLKRPREDGGQKDDARQDIEDDARKACQEDAHPLEQRHGQHDRQEYELEQQP